MIFSYQPQRRSLTSRLLSSLSRSLHALSGFALMLAAVIPLLTSGGLESGDQGALVFTGLGGGVAMLSAARAGGSAHFLIPLIVAAFFLGSSAGVAEWTRNLVADRGVDLPEVDLDAITSSVDPLSLLLIYVGAGLAAAAAVLGFVARFGSRQPAGR